MFGIIHFGDIFISTRHLVFASVRAHPANECSLLANVYLYGCKLITVAIRLYPQLNYRSLHVNLNLTLLNTESEFHSVPAICYIKNVMRKFFV